VIIPKHIIIQVMKQVLGEYDVSIDYNTYANERIADIPDEVDTKRSAHWVSISNPINFALRAYEDSRRSYSGQEFTDKIIKRAEAMQLGIESEYLGVLDI
jgi:hypothetical protein